MSQSHDPFVRRLGARPPLDRQEETALARRYVATRDPAIARQLVESNLRLVIKIAGGYVTPGHTEFADLVQEGSLGLIEAVHRFDPERGVPLGAFAAWWVRAFILRHLMATARLMRLGRSRAQRRDFFRGDLPPQELPLHLPPGTQSNEALEDLLADDGNVSPEEALGRSELAAQLQAAVRSFKAELPERERAIFRDRIAAAEPRPAPAVARRFSISRQRVLQIEHALQARFRRRVTSLGLQAA